MALDKTNAPSKDGVAGKGAAKAASDADTADKKPVSAKMAAEPAPVPAGPPVKDEGGKAKIKMMTCISFPHGTFNIGQEVELPTEQAQRYVDTGQAEPVK